MASLRAPRGSRSPRLLVLGGTGMLGHTLWTECRGRLDAVATIRGERLEGPAEGILDPARTLTGVRVEQIESVERALDESGASVAVNCVGVVKQLAGDTGAAAMVRANALFPHQLAEACGARGIGLIHISTDCVFSGDRGHYSESDRADPVDLYGRSKLAGEPEGEGVLTLRTSMIGRELTGAHGLLEWFLKQSGEIGGFTRAVFSGPTAPVLSRAICELVEAGEPAEGTRHIGAEPISKYDLLLLIRRAFGLRVEIVPDESLVIDRSLDASKLGAETGWNAPGWDQMVAELGEAGASSEKGGRALAQR